MKTGTKVGLAGKKRKCGVGVKSMSFRVTDVHLELSLTFAMCVDVDTSFTCKTVARRV